MSEIPTIYGYCDTFDYRPGATVDVHLHATAPEVRLAVVRLRSADTRLDDVIAPEEAVPEIPAVTVPGVRRAVRRGSSARIDGLGELAGARTATIELWCNATLLDAGHPQVLASTLDADQRTGFALALAEDGHPELWVGAPQGRRVALRGPRPVVATTWTRVSATIDLDAGTGALHYAPKRALPHDEGAGETRGPLGTDAATTGGATLLLAARAADIDADTAGETADHLNGLLEDVSLSCAPGGLVARWDFGAGIGSGRIVDAGGRGHHGVLRNGPSRGVTGQAWTGNEIDHRIVPHEYAAIHFHDDDFDDVRWPVDHTFALPADLPSGIYAVHAVATDGGEDRIPFIVLPPVAAGPRPRVAFLTPTMTYQAYANSKLSDRIDYEVFGLSGREYRPSLRDQQLAEVPELYGSLYDVHRDGSGRFYSSSRRPILSFRPEWQSAMQHAPRHLAADLYLTSWLDHVGEPYDVLTDHSVHDGGIAALEPYDVLVTGSHPEYVSEPELAAIEQFVQRGGRVMYLGGNGFYWVTSVDPERPHVVEVRRGNAGTRTWDSAPGETRHSTTGEPGGLWRHRGRIPNALLGVGMASQGWSPKAPGYRRTAASEAPELDWLVAGLPALDQEFGDEGLVMDGAAGDEVDRYDADLGSPRHAVVVGTSTGHPHYYKLVHEDVPMSRDGLGGDVNDKVRSDLVYLPWPGGGGVFSVGSITWAGAMALRAFDNPVATLTTNVLRRFLDPAELPAPSRESA
jgi:N,N-dimethylformamidase